jgi:hypothetical protein
VTKALVEFDRQFCEWRDNLPGHLSFTQHNHNITEPTWISRARTAIIGHFNHIYIVMHRPLLTAPYFSTPFLSSEVSIEMGINAAKENIALIHSHLEFDPPLRKWVYYCYYNFMAELALLTMLVQQPFADDAQQWAMYCNMATQSFEWMLPLDAAAKCRALSKTFLDEWYFKTRFSQQPSSEIKKRRRSNNPNSTTSVRPQTHTNVSSPQMNSLMQPSQNTFPPFPSEFQSPMGISPRQSDASYSPLNPTRYDVQSAVNYSTTQTLDAAAAETLQSFSGMDWPNQGLISDSTMGWTYNFEDLFTDLSRNDMGG